MTSFLRTAKVIRKTNCPNVTALYGEVLFWGSSKSGRMMVVCETPEGFFFVSDPSHLEHINVKRHTDTG